MDRLRPLLDENSLICFYLQREFRSIRMILHLWQVAFFSDLPRCLSRLVLYESCECGYRSVPETVRHLLESELGMQDQDDSLAHTATVLVFAKATAGAFSQRGLNDMPVDPSILGNIMKSGVGITGQVSLNPRGQC